MPINPYLQQYSCSVDKQLIQDLFQELISNFGADMFYVVRTAGAEDDLFGEDPLAYYQYTINIPGYIQNVENYGGSGELITKITGLKFDDRLTIIISQQEWDTLRDSNTYFMTNEVITVTDTKIFNLDTFGKTYSSNTNILPNIPKENDLIYIPFMDKIFVINHVNKDAIFWPLGTLPAWELTVGLWDYSSERLVTNMDEIDVIGDIYSTNELEDIGIVNNRRKVLDQPNTTPVTTRKESLDKDLFNDNSGIDNIANTAIIWGKQDPRTSGGKF